MKKNWGWLLLLREEGEASGGVNSSRTAKGDNGFLVLGDYPEKKRGTLRKM